MTSKRSREVAERMAGWFFFVVGGVLLVSSILAWNWGSAIAWLAALAGLGAYAFAALASRQTKVTVATVVLALVQV